MFQRVRDFGFLDRITGTRLAFPPQTIIILDKAYRQWTKSRTGL